jgi:glyoxylase-like metal-dependent hydrolase (beta-lactamase superfamily II)
MNQSISMSAALKPIVHGIFDEATWTVTYVVYEKEGSACAIIDSVLDYDPKSGRTSTESADKVIAFVQEKKLTVQWILETHAHADHLTAAPYLKTHLGGQTAIGDHITAVQRVFKGVFNLEASFKEDGTQFDHLLKAIRPRVWPTKWAMPCLWATPCSCPMWALPVVIFLEGAPKPFMHPHDRY